MACPGPDNTKWESIVQACGSTPLQTSCSEVDHTTCYYGYVDGPPPEGGGSGLAAEPLWFGGTFVEGESGPFIVQCPGPLASVGIEAGYRLDSINGRKITPAALFRWTPEKPARAIVYTCINDGQTIKRDLHLSR